MDHTSINPYVQKQTDDENCLMYVAFLKKIGQVDLASALSIKYLKSKAKCGDEDLLVLFYGKAIYDFSVMPNEKTIAEYAQIAEKLKPFYNDIKFKECADHPNGGANPNGWAERNENATIDTFNGFFTWLARRKKPSSVDLDELRKFCNSIKHPQKRGYRMSRYVASMSLLEVIRGVVSHEINVGTNGELS